MASAGSSSSSGSNNKRFRSESASSRAGDKTGTEIPGFVYDPIRNRYFRAANNLPDNNYTNFVDPTKKAGAAQSGNVWVHPGIKYDHSAPELTWRLESSNLSAGTRRITCAAHHHRHLRALGQRPPVIESATIPEATVKLVFDSVSAPSLEDDNPRITFAAGNLDNPSLAAELRITAFKWTKDDLLEIDRTHLMSQMRIRRSDFAATQYQNLEISSIHQLPGNVTFLSCGYYIPGELLAKGCFFLVREGGALQTMELPTFHNVTAANFQHGTLAGFSSVPTPTLLYFTFDHLSWIRGRELRKSNVVTSLDFHPTEKGQLYCGTSRNEVLFCDFRDSSRRPNVLLNRQSWDGLGIVGNCHINAVKALVRSHWLITSVAALPEDAPKIALWDCRNVRTPLTVFEGHLPFSLKKMEISLSADQTLAVASDCMGVTRFWDVGTGSLMASIPAMASHLKPQVAFYHGKENRKVLLMARYGQLPDAVIRNF